MRSRSIAFACGVLLLLTVVPASADDAYTLSFRAGASLATQSWEFDSGYSFDTEYRPGLHLGVSSELERWQRLALLGEVYYSQRGMKGQGFDNRLDYLQVGFVCTYRIGDGIGAPYLVAGPRVDIPFQNRPDEGFEAIYDDFEQIEFGVDVGAGYVLGNYLVELRYSYTFGDSYRNEGLDVHRGAVLLMLGFTVRS